MALDFIKHINDNISLSAEKKAKLLTDFCALYAYEETIPDPKNTDGPGIPNPVTKKEFVNSKIVQFIVEKVNAQRLKAGRDAVEIEELKLE